MNGGGILDDFKHAFNRPNNGHIQLILINVIVFLVLIVSKVFIDLTLGPEAFRNVLVQLAMPSNTESFLVKPWTIFTYMFVHIGFFHILFNMLFLYWFGMVIKEFLGSNRVIGLYVLGGIAGGIMYILIYNLIPFYADRVDISILYGASAGVFAVVVGAATFMPNYTFFLLFIGPVRIKYIALFYVILSFANTTGPNAGGELAHLGGALIGFLFIKQLNSGIDWSKPIVKVMHFFKSFFVKQPNIRVTYSRKEQSRPSSRRGFQSSKKSTNTKTVEQDEIDEILDKISQSGYDSLSKEEKEKLFNASKK